MEDFCRRYLAAGAAPGRKRRVIDLGSQDLNGSYRHFFDPEQWEYIGIDMAAGNNVDIVLKDPYHWEELASECADCVISGQAFEHTEYFWLSMGEIARVMRPGALCCILAPSAGPEHRYPVDCWRFYPDGMRALARYVHLETLEVYTSWDEPYHPDLSHLYRDTFFVGRKPEQPAEAS
jgi:SAM-dependent methyltransferase